MVDSGIWIPTAGLSDQTWWLDNERIMFNSNKAMSPGGGPEFMTIWNPITGKVEFLHQLTNLFCVQDGRVFFANEDATPGKFRFYRGPIDNPHEYPPPSRDIWIDKYFSCDLRSRIDRSNIPYRIQLKDDNYLEITEARLGAPVHSHGCTLSREIIWKRFWLVQ